MAEEKKEAKDLEEEEVLLDKEKKEEVGDEKNFEDALKNLFGQDEEEEKKVKAAVEEEEKIVKQKEEEEKAKKDIEKREEKPQFTAEELDRVIEKKVSQRIDERAHQESITRDIKEIRGSEDAEEKEKVIVRFLKERPEVSEGIIKESQKKGINPLTRIYDFATSEKGNEMPIEISGKGGTGLKRSKLSPEEQIAEEIVTVKTTGKEEEVKARNILL